MQKWFQVHLCGNLKVILLISQQKKYAYFLKITLSRSNISAPSQKEDGRPSMLNLSKENQGQIIECKMLFHRVKHKPLAVE